MEKKKDEKRELPDVVTKRYFPCEPTNNTNVYCEFGRRGGVFFPNPFEEDITDYFCGEKKLKSFYATETKYFVKQFGDVGVVHTNELLSDLLPKWRSTYNPKLVMEGVSLEPSLKYIYQMKNFYSTMGYCGYVPPRTLRDHLRDELTNDYRKIEVNLFQGNNVESFNNDGIDYVTYVRGPRRNQLVVNNCDKYDGRKIAVDAFFETQETLLRVRPEGGMAEDGQIRLGANSLNQVNIFDVKIGRDVEMRRSHACNFPSTVMDFRFPTQNRYFKEEEVAVACFDGSVHLISLEGQGEVQQIKPRDLGVEYSGKQEMNDWKGIEYASSPLTMYLAYSDKVFLIDRRVSFLFF